MSSIIAFIWAASCFALMRLSYLEFVKEGLVTPQALLDAGWDRLVSVLDRIQYVRVDFSMATKLLDIAQSLTQQEGSCPASPRVQGYRSCDDPHLPPRHQVPFGRTLQT